MICVFSLSICYLVAVGLSYGTWDLQYLLQHVRSFTVSCGIPGQGLNPGPALEVGSLSHWTTGEVPDLDVL